MLLRILRYLYPYRKLYRVPHKITAEYDRTAMTTEAQIIMMAGLARDPDAAQTIYDDLKAEHGENVLQHIRFELRRRRAYTAKERFMMMLRGILGEHEPRKFERRRPPDPKVKTNYSQRNNHNDN